LKKVEEAAIKDREKEEYEKYGFSAFELKQYHDSCIFDAFNEALNTQRPGGACGSNL
jgi:hypothetical protein